MKKQLPFVVFLLTFVPSIFSQVEEGKPVRPEIGVEGFLGASTLGGSYSLGLKYGFKVNENFIFGPSLRLLKNWTSNTNSQNYSYSIYGLGGFAHVRYGNMVFGGVELELFRTPVNLSGYYTGTKNTASTLFIGGGFSREFKEIVRVNAGVFYDAFNHLNSPFRNSYMMKKASPTTGQIAGYIPVIYRITFFFPIGSRKAKKENDEEDSEE